MSTGSGSRSLNWRTPSSSALPGAGGPAWQAGPVRVPYRPRWPRLALAAGAALAALAALTWAVLWVRSPAPARLVVLHAGYDANLAVPPNPYGKAAARDLAALATPGGFFGNRARLHGNPDPVRFSRPGPAVLLPDLDAGRETCVVVVLAAHGGRDRDGAFLFPDDATPDPAHRLRMTALIDRLAQLPPARQKLLVLDATQCPAFPDLGLVHNDFAAALDEMNDVIAAVPNLVVFMSSGADERSWAGPEWGRTTFAKFLHDGLHGAADADRDRRVTGRELIEYVRPRVHDWARDNRAARQTPVVLPRGDEGTTRAAAMHLAMAAGPAPAFAAPTPFEPPAELLRAWEEYRTLARASPPPEAYTPHLWRQYEAWTLRFEQHLTAGDDDGAKTARANATRLCRQIEDARRLPVRPQTLALPAGVGAAPHVAPLPDVFAAGIARVANPDPTLPAAERAKEWEQVRALPAGYDADAARVLWGYALIEYVAADPLGRLPVVPAVLPLIEGGFAVRPAELHFLAMLAAHVPVFDKSTPLGPLLKQVLTLRTRAERAAACVPKTGYSYAGFCREWIEHDIRAGDISRRQAEDLCFATDEAGWAKAAAFATDATRHYAAADTIADRARVVTETWHAAMARAPAFAEWLATGLIDDPGKNRLERELEFQEIAGAFTTAHFVSKTQGDSPHEREGVTRLDRQHPQAVEVRDRLTALDARVAGRVAGLLAARPEFEGRVTPRNEAVRWWRDVEVLLTAALPDAVSPQQRIDLVREHRRASRQLLVTNQTRPEPLPEVSTDATRERAFEAARRRGLFLLARAAPPEFGNPAGGEEHTGQIRFRLERFAFEADGRRSLAEGGSRIAEWFTAKHDPRKTMFNRYPDSFMRIVPAGADFTDDEGQRYRRTRARELLLAQARRTLADHWYDERGTPYYRHAIEQLTADADKVFARPAKDPDGFAALKAAAEEFPIVAAVPARVAVTDEPDPAVGVPLARKTGVSGRPGFAVFWIDAPFPRTPKKGDPPPRPDRAAVSTDPAAPLTPLVRPLARPVGPVPTTPVARSGPLKVNGFYRGRLLAANSTVDVYAVPEQAAVATPPTDPYAKLAVRADPALVAKYAFGAGSVAFVLDCSGSMRPDPAVRGSRGLYPVALDALRDVLAALPPGTVVSVRTFGRRAPGAKSVEETIQVLVPPITLPLDRAATVADIVAQATAITVNELYDQSPVVRAVVEAKDALKEAPGPFRAVVLISDAADNRVADDPRFATPKRGVKDVLRAEFGDAGVPLCVVALPVTNPAEVAAQKEFESVAALRPAGKFVPPEKAKELGAWLRTGLNPRVRYAVEAVETDTPVRPFDLTAAADPPDDWFAGNLPRGRYRLRVAGVPGFAHDVAVGPGERLLLDLTEDRGALALKRHWSAATAPTVARGRVEAGDRTLALLQNRLDAGKVRMVATTEAKPFVADVVTTDEMRDVWFEVRPVVPRPDPVAVRWRAVGGFPAPTWSLDITGWPAAPGGKGSAAAAVSAWPSAAPFAPAGPPWPPPGGKVVGVRAVALAAGATLDAVTIETHPVEVRPGAFEPRPCLVARLTHAAGKPVWVRPTGTKPAGSEVRFYRAANRVTCLFWWDAAPLTPDAANARVAGFEVVALATVKAGSPLELNAAAAPSEISPVADPPAGGR